MNNTYPNNELIRRVANFREELEAFMKTTDDEGNPNLDYTFEDQTKLYETMMNKAYDLALFIEQQEAEGYRLMKADADPVQAVVPDVSPVPTVDDDQWLLNVLSDDDVSPAPALDDDPFDFDVVEEIKLCPDCGEEKTYLTWLGICALCEFNNSLETF